MQRIPKGFVAALFIAGLLWPRQALAADAFDILIPKPAEFFPALVAFLIIWFVLAKFIWPSVLKTLDSRQQSIQDNIDEAQKAKVDASRALKRSQATIDEAQAEATRIVADARKSAEVSREKILAEAKQEAEEIAKKAQASIDAERKAAMEELSDDVVDLSVDLATKIIGESLDEGAQARVIERYLAKAGDVDEA